MNCKLFRLDCKRIFKNIQNKNKPDDKCKHSMIKKIFQNLSLFLPSRQHLLNQLALSNLEFDFFVFFNSTQIIWFWLMWLIFYWWLL